MYCNLIEQHILDTPAALRQLFLIVTVDDYWFGGDELVWKKEKLAPRDYSRFFGLGMEKDISELSQQA